ncbi:MAG: hypothetical protein EXS05_00660 [Planctomycetaceae bacterium]|nr:hypothetical protein [Planctomycetaceae bacterium]
MTKLSRCLTILVTVLAVAFLGVAAVTTAGRTDWQKIATKDFPKAAIATQQETIAELEKQIKITSDVMAGSAEAIAVDVKALTDPMTGREVVLERELEALIAQAHDLAVKTETEARTADARLDELKLRREDTVRLQNQFDELVSQKVAAQSEVKRLRDLLFQAQGVLERAIRRRKALQAEFGGY